MTLLAGVFKWLSCAYDPRPTWALRDSAVRNGLSLLPFAVASTPRIRLLQRVVLTGNRALVEYQMKQQCTLDPRPLTPPACTAVVFHHTAACTLTQPYIPDTSTPYQGYN